MSGFRETEKAALLALKGVAPTVIARLEQIGFSSLTQLTQADTRDVTKKIADMMGSTCWHNSPQANRAVHAMIDLAKAHVKPSH